MATNVLARQFNPEAPNRAWVCDITYVRTRSGLLYLAVVLELFSHRVVGWAMAPSMTAQLMCAALAWPLQAASHCRVYWCIRIVAAKTTWPGWHATGWFAA